MKRRSEGKGEERGRKGRIEEGKYQTDLRLCPYNPHTVINLKFNCK